MSYGDADPLKGLEFIGLGYDVLKIDPVDLKQGAKFKRALDLKKLVPIDDDSATKPAWCDYLPFSGGETIKNVKEISSSHDFKETFSGDATVDVSDPTGALFSTSLSGSFNRTQSNTESEGRVLTYCSELVTCYKLRVKSDSAAWGAVSAQLRAAVANMPTEPGPAQFEFFGMFGTHYAREVLFGGRAVQWVSVTRRDYESLMEEGVSLSAQAEMTFEIAKAGAKGSIKDDRSTAFRNASSLEVEEVMFTGGTGPQQMWDMWSMYVKDAPVPVAATLVPIYELMVDAAFPDVTHLPARREAMVSATKTYLESNGKSSASPTITTGDAAAIRLAGPGPARRLQDGGRHICTAVEERGPKGSSRWIVEDPSHVGVKGMEVSSTIALRLDGTNRYLDGMAGTDDVYDVGDGLVGTATPDGELPASMRWTLRRADRRASTRLDSGSYVLLVCQANGTDGRAGALLGESAQDIHQRVYSFGKPPQAGTIWAIERLARSDEKEQP